MSEQRKPCKRGGVHTEHYIGSLEVGKFADAIVLHNNLFEQPAEKLYQTRIERTLVGGQVVYQA